MRLPVLIFSITALLLVQAAVSFAQDPSELYNDALRKYNEGLKEDAARKLRRVLQIDSTHLEASLALGQIYLETNRAENARDVALRALKMHEKDPRVQMLMGATLVALRHPERAQPYLKAAMREPSQSIQAKKLLSVSYLNTGVNAYRKGKIEKAIRSFKEALTYNPGNSEAHRNLSIIYYRSGEIAKAEFHVRSALKVRSRDATLLRMLAQILFKQKKFQDARNILARIQGFAPGDIDSGLQLAYLYRFDNKPDSAMAVYETLLEQHPRSKKIYDAYADSFIQAAQYQRAIDLYQRLLSHDSTAPGVYKNIGDIYVKAGKLAEARFYFQRELESNRDDPNIYSAVAKTYLQKGDFQAAATVYREALLKHPSSWLLKTRLARVYEQFQPLSAIALYEQMMRDSSSSTYPLIRMGAVYEQLDSTRLAQAFYEKAIALRSSSPLPYLSRAKWKARQGDTAAACNLGWLTVDLILQDLSSLRGVVLGAFANKGRRVNSLNPDRLDSLSSSFEEQTTRLRELLDSLFSWSDATSFQQEVQASLEHYAEEPLLLEFLGRTYEESGALDAALDTYRKLVLVDPRNRNGHMGMGRVYERLGDIRQAILSCRRAFTLSQSDPKTYNALIRLSRKNGNLAELAEEWLVLAQTQPGNVVLLEKLVSVLRETGMEMELTRIESMLKEAESE
ncbi:MAG: tetratricopeptide repeat protein [Chlorobi bacterium]|nr:tetratricopeptide repeat protein [Chlorobiota bacterium]